MNAGPLGVYNTAVTTIMIITHPMKKLLPSGAKQSGKLSKGHLILTEQEPAESNNQLLLPGIESVIKLQSSNRFRNPDAK
jgi:hypothetical protein